jgi:hypothetical protein
MTVILPSVVVLDITEAKGKGIKQLRKSNYQSLGVNGNAASGEIHISWQQA